MEQPVGHNRFQAGIVISRYGWASTQSLDSCQSVANIAVAGQNVKAVPNIFHLPEQCDLLVM